MSIFLQKYIDRSIKEESYEDDKEDSSKRLKSYIIESNLAQINKDNLTIKGYESIIANTKDPTLKIISIQDKKEGRRIKFFCDILDKRFLIFYSVDEAKFANRFMDNLINQQWSNFDYPWFYNNFINRISTYGSNETFSIKFKNEFLKDEFEVSDINRITMRFWGHNGRKIIDELNEKTSLSEGVALSNIGIRFGESYSFVNENISYKGRFTLVNGNAINEHFHLMRKIKSEYSKIIRIIESSSIDYQIREEKVNIMGEPLLIEFNKEIDDLKFFINTIISSKVPFRILGISEFLNDEYASINGIDLHTGDRINIEITPKWMRIYLPKGSCGNVITRLLTNIQHHFDSKSKLFVNNGEII